MRAGRQLTRGNGGRWIQKKTAGADPVRLELQLGAGAVSGEINNEEDTITQSSCCAGAAIVRAGGDEEKGQKTTHRARAGRDIPKDAVTNAEWRTYS